jgi:hypothetical protein
MNGIPSETDYMRLAMAIDCEGMIDIHTHRQFRPHLNRVHVAHYVRIVITNTDPRLVLLCKRVFSGTSGLGRKAGKKWRASFKWYCSSLKAINLIKGCMPYFILKREQAEIALAFQATVKRIGRGGHSKKTMQTRLQLQKEMKLAKRKKWSELSTMVH